jgi:hypothetical protein
MGRDKWDEMGREGECHIARDERDETGRDRSERQRTNGLRGVT